MSDLALATRRPLIDASAPGRSRVRRTGRDERLAIIALALGAAVLAALGGAAPTGIAAVDVVYAGAAGATLALTGGRSRRWTWLVSAVAALWLTPSTLGRVAAIAAIAVALYAVRAGRRRVFGAAVGALLAFVLGGLGAGPFLGATTLYAVLAAAPIVVSGLWLMPAHRRRPIVAALSIWVAAASLAGLVFLLASLLAFGDVTDGIDAANDGFAFAADGDQAGASTAFDTAHARFDDARGKVSGFWTLPARLVPLVGQHVRAVQVVAGEGVALTDTAADAARSVDPDDIRLVDGGVDLDLIERLQPVLDRTDRALERAQVRVAEARSPWLVAPLDDRVERLLDELADARPSTRTAAAAVRELPEFLGADGPVDWLVLVTTPAEARGLGGLLSNWVLVEADGGRLSVVAQGRNEDVNRDLRARGVELSGPPQYVERWGNFMPNRFFQDVTLEPDLPAVAAVAADLFTAATDLPVDGVVALDPTALAAVLRLGGPVETGDLTLDARSVVPYLLEEQYVLHVDDEAARVLALDLLVTGAFDALTTGELAGPSAIADVFGPVVAEDRIGVWWRAGPSALVDAAGLDGRFPPVDHDMVALVHQNAGQNKLDTWLRRELDYRLSIDDGEASGTITVTLHNDLTDLTLPDAIIASNDQGYPRGTNVARLTVHTALDFRAARLDGEDVVIDRQIAFGHDAITAVIEIPPGATRVLTLEVGGRLGDGAYSLTLPQQPLVNDDLVTVDVSIDGAHVGLPTSFELSEDTVLRPPAA